MLRMLRKNIINQTPRKKKGQSTVEYIILVAAIIGALVIFLGPSGAFKNAFSNTLERGTNGMVNMADRLSGSHPLSP